MNLLHTRKIKSSHQFLISIVMVLISSLLCYGLSEIIGYKALALILLMNVSLCAMLFEVIPVISNALLSALIWNYFFIPPTFTFHINTTEDSLMFLMYFFIALLHAVLSTQIRKEENKARAQEEKEKTIQLYNTLINSLSHELRTPISTIIAAVDTLHEKKGELNLIQENELLYQIELAGIRLNQQVENLLNMSRLETGMLKVGKDWCDANELIFSEIQKLENKDSHHIIFEGNDQLPLFKFDRGLIEQVIRNLLDNAIQYTVENSTIEVKIKEVSGQCIITISDNGNGIEENKLPFIFDKFYRLPHSKTGGSGLGLSIVKGFVEAHGGYVSAKNNIDAGVCFMINIPTETSFIKQNSHE